MIDPVDQATHLTVQLRIAMRRVRKSLPAWASEEKVKAAWEADLECQALLAEETNAWKRLECPRNLGSRPIKTNGHAA